MAVFSDEAVQAVTDSAETTKAVEPPPWESKFQEMQLSFNDKFSQLQQSLIDVASRFTAPVATAAQEPIDEVTDAELEDVVAKGVGGNKLRKMVHQEMAKLKRAYIDPLEQVGLSSIANLTGEVTRRDMPMYDRFKKEIDGKLASVAPAQRLDPAVHKFVYNAVVGEHAAQLQEEAAEAAIRKSRTPAQDSPTASGRAGGIAGTASKESSFEDDFGADGVDVLQRAGRTHEQFAKGLGYASYADYKEKCKEVWGH